MEIYHIDYIVVMETRTSGPKVDSIIRKIGLYDGFRVKAYGFSDGIWCMWKMSCPPISVISSSRYCIHLKVNHLSASFWYFTIIYASPQLGGRLEL